MINRILHSYSCIIEFIKLVVKSDKMLGKHHILSLFLNLFNKFNNVRSSIYSVGQGLMISSKAPIKLSRIFFDVYFLFLLILFIIITKGPLFTMQILAQTHFILVYYSVLHSFSLAGGRGPHLPSLLAELFTFWQLNVTHFILPHLPDTSPTLSFLCQRRGCMEGSRGGGQGLEPTPKK